MVWRSFATKLALLIAILITVPAVLYGQFRSADIERTALLQRSVQEEGRLIAATLTPILANFGDGAAAKIGVQLAEIGGPTSTSNCCSARPRSRARRDSSTSPPTRRLQLSISSAIAAN